MILLDFKIMGYYVPSILDIVSAGTSYLLLLISIKKLIKAVSKPFGFIPPNIKHQKICLLSQIIMLRME